jgi:hypothetical protein
MRIVRVAHPEDRDDDLLSDKGTLTDLAHLLRRGGGGPLQAVVGGTGSLVLAGLILVFGDDGTEAMAFTALALWCFLAAWFVHHFAPD